MDQGQNMCDSSVRYACYGDGECFFFLHVLIISTSNRCRDSVIPSRIKSALYRVLHRIFIFFSFILLLLDRQNSRV